VQKHCNDHEIEISPNTNPCIPLKGKTPGLLHFEVRIDFLGSQQSADVVLHAKLGLNWTVQEVILNLH